AVSRVYSRKIRQGRLLGTSGGHVGMRRTGNTLRTWEAVSAAALLAGCMVAAAGAGAGGGIYFTQRGVESVVPATLDRAAAATATAFEQLKVRQTKSQVEQGEDG